MKIAISGANGYIGRNLINELKNNHHDLILLERETLYRQEELLKRISDTEVVIHLAGAPILKRWTKKGKAEILNSRIITTQNITLAINKLPPDRRPNIFICASAIGIYASGAIHTEESRNYSADFVGQVVRQWEESSSEMDLSVRKVIFRNGLVLGRDAKMMKQLLPLFKFGLGGKLGSGKQAFPFVHIQDVTRAISWAIYHPEIQGTYNLVAPQNCNNLQFTKTLAHLLHRPAVFLVPGFILKLVLGEAPSMVLKSPIVIPKRLTESGFTFKYPDILTCLSEIVS